jgi:hypothetical protein
MGRKRKHIQYKLLKTTFSYDQYWSILYTQVFEDNAEKDYRSIVKAHSAELARNILYTKTKEDHPRSKLKSVTIVMLRHQGYINKLMLNIEDWEHIKNSSFPNLANHLFKYEMPRPEGYINRCGNNIPSNKGHKFKKGNTMAPRVKLSAQEKSVMLYQRGKWIPWKASDRNALKAKIILALESHSNNRTRAAQFLGFSATKLTSLMKGKFIEVDWDKEYPPLQKGALLQTEKSRKESSEKGWKRRQKNYYKEISPAIINLHQKGLSNNQISINLGHSRNVIANIIIKHESENKSNIMA